MDTKQKNKMYDPLEDEFKDMSDLEKARLGRIHKALKVGDAIKNLPMGEFGTVSKTENLLHAIRMIRDQHLGCVFVVENESIIGIFTERDVLNKVVGRKYDLESRVIEDFMTPDPQTLKSDDSIAYALNRMTDGGFRHIPIVDDANRPVGLVCMKTIVNYLGEYFYDEVMNLPPTPQRTQEKREDA